MVNFDNIVDTTGEFDSDDIVQNKAMAILAYIIFAIPLLAAKESKFVRYHTNQGLVLTIAFTAYGIVYDVVSDIILMISWRLRFLVMMLGLMSMVFVALMVIGIVNAANGRAKELPVIGKIRLLK